MDTVASISCPAFFTGQAVSSAVSRFLFLLWASKPRPQAALLSSCKAPSLSARVLLMQVPHSGLALPGLHVLEHGSKSPQRPASYATTSPVSVSPEAHLEQVVYSGIKRNVVSSGEEGQ